MDVTKLGTPGVQGSNGASVGQPGTAGGPGGPATVTNSGNGADTNNTAEALGGNGGKGGDGGSGAGTGGKAGAGGPGGNASASTTVTLATASGLTSKSSATGGDGGSAGPPGNSGALNTGLGAAGGAGGTATGAAAALNPSGGAYARANTVGGTGGGSFGPGGKGGAGGVASGSSATARGSSADARANQRGGQGGAGNSNASGGAGAASTLTNAVSASTTGGVLRLEQSATGGAGGGSNGGGAGAGGGATSQLTFNDVAANPTHPVRFYATSDATGGAGGAGQGVASGAPGADATARAQITGDHHVNVIARAIGGLGGGTNGTGNGANGGLASASASGTSQATTSDSVVVNSYAIGGAGGAANGTGSAGTGNGGSGGKASGSTAVATALAGKAEAMAAATGGLGGVGRGIGHSGGAGGSATQMSADATGFNARATTTLTGGDGGDGFRSANGGAGASLVGEGGTAVGRSTGGYLILDDTVRAGSGGAVYIPGSQAGAAGIADTYKHFDDTSNSTHASSLTSTVRSFGGNAGVAKVSGAASGGFGGAGSAKLTLVGAHVVSGIAYGIGGIGGRELTAYAEPGGAGSATAAATSVGTSSTDTAAARAVATGGAGTKLGAANATASATTAARQSASATSTATGASGQAQATSTTHGAGVVVMVSGVAAVTATPASAGAANSVTARSDAEFGTGGSLGAAQGYDAYTSVTGLPDSGVVASELSTHPNIKAELGTSSAVVFGAGVQGGGDLGNGPLNPSTSTDTFTLNTTNLTGHLILGLLDGGAGDGFTSSRLIARVAGATVLDKTFVSPEEGPFLDDDPLDLGAVPASANLQVALTFELNPQTAFGWLGESYLLGVTSVNGPPPVIAAPVSADVVLGMPTAIGGISLSENGSTAGETYTVTLTDANGLLSATGTGVSGADTITLRVTGSLAQVNSALATVTDTETAFAADTITINAFDSFGKIATPASIRLAYLPPALFTEIPSLGTVPIIFGPDRAVLRIHSLNGTPVIGNMQFGDSLDLVGSSGGALNGNTVNALGGTIALDPAPGGYVYKLYGDAAGGQELLLNPTSPPPEAVSDTDAITNISTNVSGDDYTGPVDYLQRQYIWPDHDPVAMRANVANAFIKGGANNDALQVFGGNNVLDGGTGSNFLIGGDGTDGGIDTFFLDTRTGAVTWSTIVGFHKGDQATIFGFHPNLSTRPETASDGVDPYKGFTIHSEINGQGSGVNGSLTFAGINQATADSHFVYTTGTLPGNIDYLLIQYL